MDLDASLTRHHIIDCTGQITHTLTLQIDGTVRVAFTGGREIVADPATRSSLTPGAVVPEGLWSEISVLAF